MVVDGWKSNQKSKQRGIGIYIRKGILNIVLHIILHFKNKNTHYFLQSRQVKFNQNFYWQGKEICKLGLISQG